MQITRTPAPVPGRHCRPGAVDRQRICAKKNPTEPRAINYDDRLYYDYAHAHTSFLFTYNVIGNDNNNNIRRYYRLVRGGKRFFVIPTVSPTVYNNPYRL